MSVDFVILVVGLEPVKLFGGERLEATRFVILSGTLEFALLDLGTWWPLIAPWEADVCLSTGLAVGVFRFVVFIVDFCVALATEDLFTVLGEDDVWLGVDL